jgi:hypothetical protein
VFATIGADSVRDPVRTMRPPRSTHCPRCGFSFGWDGRKCSHCPPPARARQLWEQIGRLAELVGSEKSITQRQLRMIAAGCLRRVAHLLPEAARDAADQLDRDPDDFVRRWGKRAVRPRYSGTPAQIAETGLRLLAHALATVKALDARAVQAAAGHWSQAAGVEGHPPREMLSFPLPPELEPHRAAVATALAMENAEDDIGSRTEDDPVRVAFDNLSQQVMDYDRQRWRAEEAAQCDIARDVLGYPEVTVTFDPEWRTSTAVAIVREMYESRDIGAMPILADALQDAGCDEPEILEHCRADQSHVHGCWVCEAVLSMS